MNIIEGETPPEKNVELDKGGKNVPGAFAVKTSHYIIGGFALATAITWNTSIREVIKQKFPIPEDNVKANMIFAMVMTLILVLLIYVLPNTKSELPDTTRQKIAEEEKRHILYKKVQDQEKKISKLSNELRNTQATMYKNSNHSNSNAITQFGTSPSWYYEHTNAIYP